MPEMHDLSPLPEGGEITCELFKANDREQVISCLASTFSESEPMTKTLKIAPSELLGLAELICNEAISKGVSLVAKDNRTGRIAAFSLAGDFTDWPPQGIERVNAKVFPILALVSDLDEEYKKNRKIMPGEIFHLSFLGSCGHYKKRKIATTIVRKHLQLAQVKGFTCAVAEVTGPASQHILIDKFGFVEKCRIDYKSYLYCGVRVFENIKDVSSCFLVEKRFVP
ncbi:MAG: hypothetical protein AB1847_09670 [bacterium]